MAGVKFIENVSFSRLKGATKMGIVFKSSLVYTDKRVRKVIQKYHCLG